MNAWDALSSESEEDEWVMVYVSRDGMVYNAPDALDFLREEIYDHGRAPYLARWQRDPATGVWDRQDEEWELED